MEHHNLDKVVMEVMINNNNQDMEPLREDMDNHHHKEAMEVDLKEGTNNLKVVMVVATEVDISSSRDMEVVVIKVGMVETHISSNSIIHMAETHKVTHFHLQV
jgi:hypothetical protein